MSSRILRSSAVALFVILLSTLVGVLAAPHADAGGPTLTVDTTDDNPALFACTVAANDCSLRGAITAANGIATTNIIELASSGTYVLDEAGINENTNATGDLDILAPIFLEGNGSTINADGIDRVFDIALANDQQVSLHDVTITGGDETFFVGGGGIYFDGGILTLDTVTIDDNETNYVGGGIYMSGDSSITITDSTLSNNIADQHGGGIYKGDGTGGFEIASSNVTGNHGISGGGLLIGISSPATITDTDVAGNVATGADGGGVYAGSVSLHIVGGTISNNQAPNTGGGAYLPSVDITGTIFSGNTAGDRGGGLYAFDGSITGATFASNSAGKGAGIYGDDLTISNTTISGNTATGDGGGVRMGSGTHIDHSLISGNTAGDKGGGVTAGAGSSDIANSTISGNTAASGGGVAKGSDVPTQPLGDGPLPQGPLTLSFVTVADNTATSGANIHNDGTFGPVVVGSSIIADPHTGSECNTALVTDDYNVAESTSCGLSGTHDIEGVDAFLLPLDDNGGPTQTQALAVESPAIDRALDCPPPANDQTGDSRPKGNACDSGAFESDFTGPTPAPTDTAAPTATPTAPATPTTTPAASPTATPVLTPSGTPSGDERTWGDSDCSGQIGARDNQALLRNVLSQAPLSQTEPCPDLGHVLVEPPLAMWGDWDCNGSIGARDNQALLRHVLGQPPLSQTEPCPDIGTSVAIAG